MRSTSCQRRLELVGAGAHLSSLLLSLSGDWTTIGATPNRGNGLGIRDPFYAEIERALETGLDTAVFEQLAAELVGSKGYPTSLAPGGADNGYDFELLDSTQEPGPGVATTSDRVTSNLRRNLEQNRKNCPRAAKRTYIVTSTVLTSRKRDNLKRVAASLGYTCLGASDRHEVARYIYANPHWARELLGLTGTPSALSVVPRTSRPLLDIPLVGREEADQSLRQLRGDALLVGSPGSGKTALLTHLVADGLGSFMVSRDMTAVANAARQQQPETIVIDDLDDIVGAARDLLQLRQELGANFRIVVTDWERNPELEQLLGLTVRDIIALEQLTRDEIVGVVLSVGIGGPPALVREIVDQAEGMPGLAVTLAQAALAGDYQGLFGGDKLGSLMEATVNRLLGDAREGERSVLALASIALAGDSGLTLDVAADFLGVSKGDLQAMLKRLASGGIIRSIAQKVTVRPPSLRRYMIRKAFFAAGAADYAPLLEVVPNVGRSVIELIKVSHMGVAVPGLLQLVLDSGDTMAARCYVASGERQARDFLLAAPEMSLQVASEALNTAPDAILPSLLRLAVGDGRELHNTPEHPLRRIKDWANSARPGSGEVIRRKRAVVASALRWMADGKDVGTACRACTEVLTTAFEARENDPGSGMRIHLLSGMLTDEEISELVPLWEQLRDAVRGIEQLPWSSLLSLCRALVHPSVYGDGSPGMFEASRRLGARVIADLGSLAEGHPGVLERLNLYRGHLGLLEMYEIPNDYEVLLGELDHSDWEREESRRTEQIRQLANEWLAESPTAFAERIKWLHDEAALVGTTYDRSPQLCRLVAEGAPNPGLWLAAVADASLDTGCLLPFLDRAIQENGEEWESLVRPMLDDPVTEAGAIDAILRAPHVSDEIWSAVSPMLPRYGPHITTLCVRGQVPPNTLRRLLNHDCLTVTDETAVGTWWNREHGDIPPELRQDWESAVVKIRDENHFLDDIFESSPSVAFRWLSARIKDNDWHALWNRKTLRSACRGLSHDERLSILESLKGQLGSDDVAAELIGSDQKLYRDVLRNPSMSDNWEYALHRDPDEQWRLFAGIALEEGETTREVAGASMLRSESWTGPESAHLQKKIDAFSVWLDDPNAGIIDVARMAVEYLTIRKQKAIADERREAIEGHW